MEAKKCLSVHLPIPDLEHLVQDYHGDYGSSCVRCHGTVTEIVPLRSRHIAFLWLEWLSNIGAPKSWSDMFLPLLVPKINKYRCTEETEHNPLFDNAVRFSLYAPLQTIEQFFAYVQTTPPIYPSYSSMLKMNIDVFLATLKQRTADERATCITLLGNIMYAANPYHRGVTGPTGGEGRNRSNRA